MTDWPSTTLPPPNCVLIVRNLRELLNLTIDQDSKNSLCNLWRLFRTNPLPASSSSVQGLSPKTAWLCFLYVVFLFWAITSGGEGRVLIINCWVGIPGKLFTRLGIFHFPDLWSYMECDLTLETFVCVCGFIVFVIKVQERHSFWLCFGGKHRLKDKLGGREKREREGICHKPEWQSNR